MKCSQPDPPTWSSRCKTPEYCQVFANLQGSEHDLVQEPIERTEVVGGKFCAIP